MNCFHSLAFLVWIFFWSPILFFDSSVYYLHLPAWRSLPAFFIYLPVLANLHRLPELSVTNLLAHTDYVHTRTQQQHCWLAIHPTVVQQKLVRCPSYAPFKRRNTYDSITSSHNHHVLPTSRALRGLPLPLLLTCRGSMRILWPSRPLHNTKGNSGRLCLPRPLGTTRLKTILIRLQ